MILTQNVLEYGIATLKLKYNISRRGHAKYHIYFYDAGEIQINDKLKTVMFIN